MRILTVMGMLALWCLTAFATSLPKGILPFGILVMLSTILAPDIMYRHVRAIRRPLLWVTGAVAATLIVISTSIVGFGLEWKEMDNYLRLLAVPWCMLWAYTANPSKSRLWQGAIAGSVLTCGLTVGQAASGAVRVSGWNTNAIVFADTVLMMLVIALFCTPAKRWPWTILATTVGGVALALTGTRSAWLGLLVALFVMLLTGRWAKRRVRIAVAIGGLATVLALFSFVPGLNQRVRVVELLQDIERYEQGDIHSSSGLRVERLQVAAKVFAKHPWSGVGIGQFDAKAMAEEVPECRNSMSYRCHIGHAHNDLAEWTATMGIPGTLALIGIYAVPFFIFLTNLRRIDPRTRWRSATMTGLMLVTTFVLCGMTQSMFAHQLTAIIFGTTVGVTLGLAMRERDAFQATQIRSKP